MLILAGGDKLDLGLRAAGAVHRDLLAGEPEGPGSAIFPRLLPRSCRQMSCTWMIHLFHRRLRGRLCKA